MKENIEMASSTTTPENLEDLYQVPTYAKMPLSIERGEGCFVYDSDNVSYLDMYGGHAVVCTGHCHPHVVESVQKQAARLIFYSNATYNSVRAAAVRKLVEAAGEPFRQVFLVNSGGEANDNAIKLARAMTGRVEILSFQNSFHGRTYGSLSATGVGKYRDYLNTPVPGHRILSVEDASAQISEKTAAVLVEPIQSMGGVVTIPIEVLKAIEAACRKKGALLIFDEIQTGLCRTGPFLYAQRIGVTPDIVTLAKGLASGLPAGAVLVTGDLGSKINKGDLGSTFGGNPLTSAAILATLEVLETEHLGANAKKQEEYLWGELAALEEVVEIRGAGLLIGIQFKGRTAKEIQAGLFERRILAGTSSDPQVLRLMPPLTLSRQDAGLFLESLQEL